MVFLDPGFATELLRPLVDHTLTSAADAKADVEKYVSATPGLASDAGLVENLLREIDAFVAMGLLSPRLLPFFWRATALAPADHDAAKRMLLDAGVLIEVAAGEEMRLMMPMRMSVLRPPAVADSWDAKPPENQKGEARQGVRFDLTGGAVAAWCHRTMRRQRHRTGRVAANRVLAPRSAAARGGGGGRRQGGSRGHGAPRDD